MWSKSCASGWASDGAWEFIEAFLSQEEKSEGSFNSFGFPTLKSKLNAMALVHALLTFVEGLCFLIDDIEDFISLGITHGLGDLYQGQDQERSPRGPSTALDSLR